MLVIPLPESDRIDLVGGKASGLGELIRRGERVPPGFVVTTEAHRLGALPQAEILAAYRAMGSGPVAVRSSATAEDLPDASFAGQHETFLQVEGDEQLLSAVAKCWASLHGERAVAYRSAHETGTELRMAVIVQRMVQPTAAGVLFTANPLTGNRTEMLVDAVPGLGTGVVDGTADADHYVLGDPAPDGHGCLSAAQLAELRAAGERAGEEPRDIEWAFDAEGVLWLLQSRPITTLFPLPPASDGPLPRVYVEFGHVQGMLQPVTPMGMAGLKRMIAAMTASLGLRAEIVDIGGRLYGDLSDLARHRTARKRLIKLMAVDFGPRAQAAMEHVLADPRFAPGTAAAKAGRPAEQEGGSALRTAGRALSGITRALARPEAARLRLQAAVDRLRSASDAPADLRTSTQRLDFVSADDSTEAADDLTWPIVAGMLAAALPGSLLKGLASPDEIHTVLGGLPDNVTLEMDLALWRLARDAGQHRDLLIGTPPAELAARYRQGDLPDIGLTAFLAEYGHRGPAEADLGVPRWAEDPTGVFAAIANYLRVTDPEQAPDVRFARTAERAQATLEDLARRVRRRRPVRGSLAVFLLRRARTLSGLRESGKFAGLYRLRAVREQLLLIGADLAAGGLLDEPADIMFLDLDEAAAAVRDGVDQRELVARRKALHRVESRRRHVPVALLSDGTDVETVLPAKPGGLHGVGASAGRVTGPARIVHDPATAHIEPGDILVVSTTDPAWTPLFLTAGGLVTETGAIMAHGPTVAREYGIPAVISVPGATDRITPGQLITVDGAAGTVTPVPAPGTAASPAA
ncbi:PEP/pyruvate-binding domain-containing protein [Actinoplanes aureus]|uniref:Pyruvate, water dikinase n=1 Tax=Actinoplanes aureus TaxID=2792083 RepID=A0A931CIA7_9ACTN|nr:PEP/pyruvate-binding domain-containing protein [Actinoplanes aureus]MBG0568517.1 pyruvate, water dikinase [Actinoplanes aureus]